jgi:hypothetical protein
MSKVICDPRLLTRRDDENACADHHAAGCPVGTADGFRRAQEAPRFGRKEDVAANHHDLDGEDDGGKIPDMSKGQ